MDNTVTMFVWGGGFDVAAYAATLLLANVNSNVRIILYANFTGQVSMRRYEKFEQLQGGTSMSMPMPDHCTI